MIRSAPLLIGFCCACLGCTQNATPLPTSEAVSQLDRTAQPALYQMLYDAPLLPESQEVQQRVRILIWLIHMDLNVSQLEQLDTLRQSVAERRQRIRDAEASLVAETEAAENQVYQTIWSQLEGGVAIDDPQLNEHATKLSQLHQGGEQEQALLRIRMEGIRSIFEAEQSFLYGLDLQQEQLMADAVFFLRNQLDPIGNPGDFRALVGSIYEPGQYSVLTRGNAVSNKPLNIGALWSDEPILDKHPLHEARREVLLYLALMEPGLKDAIAMARKRAQETEPEPEP